MRILAIDPGSEHSAWLIYDTDTGLPVEWRKRDNESVIYDVATLEADLLAVEMVASYGMAVGAEVFSTCVWIGRFIEGWKWGTKDSACELVYRKDVKLHLCGSIRAKDSNVRQALLDRYGGKEKAVGKKANPGPLYGVSGDVWSALAVAVTASGTAAIEQARL